MRLLVLPRLDFTPGPIVCLHIPHGFHDQMDAVERDVVQAAQRAGRSARIGHPARTRQGLWEFFRKQRTVDWLAHAAGVQKPEAATIISGLDVSVPPLVCQCANSPRCFLGLAAALSWRPDVIVYSTAGLDPLGRWSAHQYVREHGGNAVAVHLSLTASIGNGTPAPRGCPSEARCVDLQPG